MGSGTYLVKKIKNVDYVDKNYYIVQKIYEFIFKFLNLKIAPGVAVESRKIMQSNVLISDGWIRQGKFDCTSTYQSWFR